MAGESKGGGSLEQGSTIGERIRSFRVARSMTQEDLARRMGTQRPAVSNWENGVNTPSVPTLKKLGEILAIPFRALVDDDTSQENSVEAEANGDDSIGARLDLAIRRLNDAGPEGSALAHTALRLFARMERVAAVPGGDNLFRSIAEMARRSLEHAGNILAQDEVRRTETFLRELNIALDMRNHQSRLARMTRLFVPPPEYNALFDRITSRDHVLVLTGPRHAGKTFLGLRLLVDLAAEGYRPHFESGRCTGLPAPGAPADKRLADIVRSGQAVLIDDPFTRDCGVVAVREFAANAIEAMRSATVRDVRMVIAVDDDDLDAHPEFGEACARYVHRLDARLDATSLRRIVATYTETYHPGTSGLDIVAGEGPERAHEVERVLAVPTDNRQTIRRRALNLQREGIGRPIRDDLSALSDAEITMLVLVAAAPLPWNVLAEAFDSTGVRGIGGETTTIEQTYAALFRWLVAPGQDDQRRPFFLHPSYRELLYDALGSDARIRSLGANAVRSLASAHDVSRQVYAARLAVAIVQRDPSHATDLIEALSSNPDAGVTVRATSVGMSDGASSDPSFADAIAEAPIGAAAWLFRGYPSLPSDSCDAARIVRDGGVWERLTAAYVSMNGNVGPATLDAEIGAAIATSDNEARVAAAQAAICRADRMPAERVRAHVVPLIRDADRGVATLVRRAVMANVAALPHDLMNGLLEAF